MFSPTPESQNKTESFPPKAPPTPESLNFNIVFPVNRYLIFFNVVDIIFMTLSFVNVAVLPRVASNVHGTLKRVVWYFEEGDVLL